MDIKYRASTSKRGWVAEVWTDQPDPVMGSNWGFSEPYPEEVYVKINDWCIKTFGYHARTAYHIFELKNKKDLNWFLLKWSGE